MFYSLSNGHLQPMLVILDIFTMLVTSSHGFLCSMGLLESHYLAGIRMSKQHCLLVPSQTSIGLLYVGLLHSSLMSGSNVTDTNDVGCICLMGPGSL